MQKNVKLLLSSGNCLVATFFFYIKLLLSSSIASLFHSPQRLGCDLTLLQVNYFVNGIVSAFVINIFLHAEFIHT